jgi:hypothetical protein
MKDEGRRKKEEGRKKKEEGRSFDIWVQTPTQNGQTVSCRGIKPPTPG